MTERPKDEVVVTMRLPRWLRDQFQVYAKSRERSLSSEVRLMMISALERWAKDGGRQLDAFQSASAPLVDVASAKSKTKRPAVPKRKRR